MFIYVVPNVLLQDKCIIYFYRTDVCFCLLRVNVFMENNTTYQTGDLSPTHQVTLTI